MDKYITALPYLCILLTAFITAYFSFRKWNQEVRRILIEIGRIKLSNNIQSYNLASFVQFILNEKKKTCELTEEEKVFWQNSRQTIIEAEHLIDKLKANKDFS